MLVVTGYKAWIVCVVHEATGEFKLSIALKFGRDNCPLAIGNWNIMLGVVSLGLMVVIGLSELQKCSGNGVRGIPVMGLGQTWLL